jgi:hypothetical protein
MTEKIARIGTVSEGTMRNEDLIPAFMDALKGLECKSGAMAEISARMEDDSYYESEDADYDLEVLFDLLQTYAPLYCYFGAHSGDGSDYGFWPDIDQMSVNDFDGIKVADTAKIPLHYSGFALHTNDHGNTTLYNVRDGQAKEVWGIV